MMATERRRNTATSREIAPLLQTAFPNRLQRDDFPPSSIAFLEKEELLVEEILLTAPRVTAGLIQDGCKEASQDADSDVVDSFFSGGKLLQARVDQEEPKQQW